MDKNNKFNGDKLYKFQKILLYHVSLNTHNKKYREQGTGNGEWGIGRDLTSYQLSAFIGKP